MGFIALVVVIILMELMVFELYLIYIDSWVSRSP